MLYDLQGEANMTPIAGMLYSAVAQNNQRLQLAVYGMSQAEADYKGPDSGYNSTAQLIRHLTYVDLNWVYRMRGEPLPHSLQAKYGPMIDADNRLPMVTGMPLSELLSNYEAVLTMLKNICTELTDAELDKVVAFGHHNEKQATIRWGLWHIADHSRYHQAQINQLRKWYNQ